MGKACWKCTYINEDDSAKCVICEESFKHPTNETESQTITTSVNRNANEDDDGSDSSDLEILPNEMDFTHLMRDEPDSTFSHSTISISNSSQSSSEDEELNHRLKEAMQQSLESHQDHLDRKDHIRKQKAYLSELLQIDNNDEKVNDNNDNDEKVNQEEDEPLNTTNISSSSSSSLYSGEFKILFDNFNHGMSSSDNSNTNSIQSMANNERKRINPPSNNQSEKPPSKRQKLSNDPPHRNKPNTNEKKDKEEMEVNDIAAYDRYNNDTLIQAFFKGEFCERALSIEFGPHFKGKTKKFNQLTVGQQKIIPQFNADLPVYTAQFKHKKWFKNDEYIYSNYVIIRLDWKVFEDINTSKDKHYNSIPQMIAEVRRIMSVVNKNRRRRRKAETDSTKNMWISVLLDDIEQKVTTINQKRQRNQNNKKNKDIWCPYFDAHNLKNKMNEISLFRDRNVHFEFKSATKIKAHLERIAFGLCHMRFEQLKIQPIQRKSGHLRYYSCDGPVTNMSVFKAQLLSIKGVSEETITKIVRKYPTIGRFRKECKNEMRHEREPSLLLIRSVPQISVTISQRIYTELDLF